MRRAGVLLLVLSLMIGCDSREPDDRYAGTVLVLDLEGSTPTRSVLPDETLVSDVNLLINAIIGDGVDLEPYPNADVNGDGQVNISDVTALIAALLNAE